MNFPSPTLLPKVRSDAIRSACRHMPCTLRIASFIPGHRCADQDTVVGCHTRGFGEGMGTKSSDLSIAAGCRHCHNLIDLRDERWEWLAKWCGAAVEERIRRGNQETLAMLLMMGIIFVPDGEII